MLGGLWFLEEFQERNWQDLKLRAPGDVCEDRCGQKQHHYKGRGAKTFSSFSACRISNCFFLVRCTHVHVHLVNIGVSSNNWSQTCEAMKFFTSFSKVNTKAMFDEVDDDKNGLIAKESGVHRENTFLKIYK